MSTTDGDESHGGGGGGGDETPEQTIARLRAENKKLKKGLKSNLKMLDELEELYQEEKAQVDQQLKQEILDKEELQKKLDAAEEELADLQVEVAVKNRNEEHQQQSHVHDAPPTAFWDFIKDMEGLSELLAAKIATAKENGGSSSQDDDTTKNDSDEKKEEDDDVVDLAKIAAASAAMGGAAAAASTAMVAVPKRNRRMTAPPPGMGNKRGAPEPADFDPAVMARRRGSVMSGMAKLKRGVHKINAVKSFNSKEKFTSWSATLRRADPRYQILSFFDQIAKKGADALSADCAILETGFCTRKCLPEEGEGKQRAMSIFHLAGVFTVWRPTSLMSIRRMMIGEGVGKGLDIKGKSAKKGHLSAFVPFLQLHEERHKWMVRSIPITAQVRIFFHSKEGRDQVQQVLVAVAKEMMAGYDEAQEILARLNEQEEAGEFPEDDQELLDKIDAQREECYAKWTWELEPNDVNVVAIDDYAPKVYGLQVSQRVFFETYVMRGDCDRPEGSMHDTGRRSEPAFQDMNMETLRNGAAADASTAAPRPVIMQYTKDPNLVLDPKYLLIAYEEKGKVCPVVSDFDCFLVGTRRINFDKPLPPEQVKLMKWCVEQIEKILGLEPSAETWTMRWLENLKQEYKNGFHVDLPKYGFADPKSYNIMAHAVDRLVQHGSVRHGAECFNYYFPQDLDDEFLVITNNQPNGPWVKHTRETLLQCLSDKIDEGFMFPLNPKWVLCDPGWKLLWDKQMATDNIWARKALDSWYPPDSGIREMVERIHTQYPKCFQVNKDEPYRMETQKYSPLRHAREKGEDISADNAMDLGLLEVQHDRLLQKALKAVNAIIFSNRMRKLLTPRQRASLAKRKSSLSNSKTSQSMLMSDSNMSLTSIGELGDISESAHSIHDKDLEKPKEKENGNQSSSNGKAKENNKESDKENGTKNGSIASSTNNNGISNTSNSSSNAAATTSTFVDPTVEIDC